MYRAWSFHFPLQSFEKYMENLTRSGVCCSLKFIVHLILVGSCNRTGMQYPFVTWPSYTDYSMTFSTEKTSCRPETQRTSWIPSSKIRLKWRRSETRMQMQRDNSQPKNLWGNIWCTRRKEGGRVFVIRCTMYGLHVWCFIWSLLSRGRVVLSCAQMAARTYCAGINEVLRWTQQLQLSGNKYFGPGFSTFIIRSGVAAVYVVPSLTSILFIF